MGRWREQRTAAVHLASTGAEIELSSVLPDWIQEWLPDGLSKHFDEVTAVSAPFYWIDLSDREMQAITSFSGLRRLSLESANIPEIYWPRLAQLHCLEDLSLSNCHLRDRHLNHLHDLKALKSLTLDGNAISVPGLAHLKNLGQLETLSLRDMALTDDALEQLVDLPSLKSVSVCNTQITKSAASNFTARSRQQAQCWIYDLGFGGQGGGVGTFGWGGAGFGGGELNQQGGVGHSEHTGASEK